jgi:hypothetical protein
MIRENMTDKDVTLKNLLREKEELEQELEFKGGIDSEIEGKIYEVEDTIKKIS